MCCIISVRTWPQRFSGDVLCYFSKDLASAEQNKSHCSAEIRRKEQQLARYEEQLFNVCGSQDFQSDLGKLQDDLEKCSKQRGTDFSPRAGGGAGMPVRIRLGSNMSLILIQIIFYNLLSLSGVLEPIKCCHKVQTTSAPLG